MKPRVQSSILLLATLLIGVLLGALLQSSLREKRMKHIDFLRSSDGFVTHMIRVIDPVSPEQEASVRAVLEAAAPAITDAFKAHRDRTRQYFMEMEQRLGPLLDEDQEERLKRRLNPPRHRPEKQEPPPGD